MFTGVLHIVPYYTLIILLFFCALQNNPYVLKECIGKNGE